MDPLIADLEQRVKTGDANDTWALGFSSGSMVFQRSAILCPMTAKAIARTNHTEKVRGILLMMQNYRLLEDDKAIPTCDPIRQGCYAFGLLFEDADLRPDNAHRWLCVPVRAAPLGAPVSRPRAEGPDQGSLA